MADPEKRSAKRKSRSRKRLTPPDGDVRELQKPDHTEADFLEDLEKLTSPDAKKRLERASERGPEWPKT
jgi:hypothetical protein